MHDAGSHDEDHQALVIGSGPAGLASAAELSRRGIEALVLERGDRVGAAWAGRYDGLRFNTSRLYSALPGAPFDRAWGQFPTRDQYVGYLDGYADRHELRVRTGVRVLRLHQDDDGWRAETDTGDLRARHVVVATGIFNEPVLPAWATSPEFPGQVLHAAHYRNAQPFAGRDVLVVGAGTTGLEIAHELVVGGSTGVWLSYRTPPNLVLREVNGRPGDLPVPLFLHLPTPLVDRFLLAMQRRMVGDLSPYGLSAPTQGPISQVKARGAGTAVVDPPVLADIRSGAIRVVPAVRALDRDGALLVDDRRVRPEVVIAATGYRTGLRELLGDLDVLDDLGMPLDRKGGEVAPGLRFVGYVYRPGITGYAGRLARRAAAGIAARETASRRARRGWRRPASPGSTSHDRVASQG